MHRGAFVTLASQNIKTVSLETILGPLVVCDCSHNHLYFSTCSTTSEVLFSQYSIQLKEALNLLISTINLIVSYWTNFFLII